MTCIDPELNQSSLLETIQNSGKFCMAHFGAPQRLASRVGSFFNEDYSPVTVRLLEAVPPRRFYAPG